MSTENTSLDLLHDIVMPPEASWWPPAPGWYGLAAIVLLVAVLFLRRWYKRWLANAYRRQALQLLGRAQDAVGIAEILRRTALALAPRSEVAAMNGTAWVDWLENHAPVPMPDPVSRLLADGIYVPEKSADDIDKLRQYAELWIRMHRAEEKS